MILVDSSVWIDYFRGIASAETDALDGMLGKDVIATGDLILVEVLQGFVQDKDFVRARQLMGSLVALDLAGQENAVKAAAHFRSLRRLGVTVRKTIDTLIATYCIAKGVPLLYSDRDFDPFVKHLGLQSVTGRTAHR